MRKALFKEIIGELVDQVIEPDIPQHIIEATIQQQGETPLYPLGQCFLNVCRVLAAEDFPSHTVIVHAVITCNLEGYEGYTGQEIAHAWIEVGSVVYECTWGVKCLRSDLEAGTNILHEVRYSLQDFMSTVLCFQHPGPWDKQVRQASHISYYH